MAVAIYARKSTDRDDRQVQSLDDQLSALREIAEREHLIVAEEVVESRSAKDPGTRPEFSQMVQQIRSGLIDGLLVWDITRLSRNMEEGGVISHMLQTGKLKFIRTSQRTYWPEDSALILAIETGSATDELQRLSARVKRGLTGKAERGWLPVRAPLGYVNNPDTKEIEPDPLRFDLVKQAWTLFLQGGRTVTDVYREVTKLGLTNYNGERPVTPSKFYAMFSKPFYYGKFEYQGTMYQGKHVPMVTEEDFDRAQMLLPRANGLLLHRDPERKHPFAGVFKCPVCGCQITAETKKKTYKTTRVYRSYTYYRCTGARGCPKNAVRSGVIEEAMSRVATHCKRKSPFVAWGFEEMVRATAEAERITIADEALKSKASTLEKRLARLRELRVNDELSSEEYLEEKSIAQKSLSETNIEIEKHSRLHERIDNSIVRKNKTIEEFQGWEKSSTTAKRGLIQAISQECFLTLESLQIWIDPAMHKIITIELPETSSGRAKSDDLVVLNFDWQCQLEAIRTLESEILQSKNESKICIEVIFSTMELKIFKIDK